MFQRIALAVLTLWFSTAAFAQDATELSKRVEELRQQIDVLTHEIEALRSGEKKEAKADTTQYGLGAAASKVYRAEPGVSFGGYGEFTYKKPEHGEAQADLLRAVLYTGYKFSDRALFNSEIEVEHASTEHGGAVSAEFAYLDYLVRPTVNVRAGMLLVPMGLINEQHEPTAYLGANRPQTERFVIPSTWSELGAGVFGERGSLSYRAYVMTGLNEEGFTADEGIREGRQGGAEANAEHLAFAGRADWHPVEGTILGGSLYAGKTASGAHRVRLGEAHADSRFGAAIVRALYSRGRISGTLPAGSVANSIGGWYLEGGYDLASLFAQRNYSLMPYARYERIDTGVARRIFTAGAAFKPIPQSVIKLDWQKVRDAGDQFNLSLGYIF